MQPQPQKYVVAHPIVLVLTDRFNAHHNTRIV